MNTSFITDSDINNCMEVIKRSGVREKVAFDKITKRIEALCYNVHPRLDMTYVDPISIAKEVIDGVYNGITTESLDYLSADVCANRIADHPHFNDLAARITISNLHKKTESWSRIEQVADKLYNHFDGQGKRNPLISKKTFDLMNEHKDLLNETIDFDRDYRFDFFGIKTLERSYLKRIKKTVPQLNISPMGKGTKKKSKDTKLAHDMELLRAEQTEQMKKGIIIERPQHMWMRVAIGIHGDDLKRAIETYNLMSTGAFTHATPTLFNSGCDYGNLSSCFLLGMHDSIQGIFKNATDCGLISKRAGGIGVHMSNVRASGSRIRTTNGTSNGIVPWCRLLCEVARSVNQGGKRNGSIAVYVEPWHADIFDFCELRKNTGVELKRARDLFLALWVPNLFMKRVMTGGMWSLFCPDEAPGLTDTYGEKFEELYLEYERKGMYKRQVPASKLWFHILDCQIETGMPYVAFKDNANERSNQKNIGVIKSSNLCCEIFEYSDEKEYATCNLASISLKAFIIYKENGELDYDFNRLMEVSRVVAYNLNRVIDINHYPVPETKRSNLRHRPLGVGVQGLADLMCIFKYPFGSEECRVLSKKIHETIYYGCMKETVELAKKYGAYETFPGSPFSEGKLQFDLWGLSEDDLLMEWDWDSLKADLVKTGARNSLTTAMMPTASTSQILGNNECIEPFTTNLYTRSTLAGNYTIINKYLVHDLIQLGLWDDEMREELIYFGGSVQHIDRVPYEIKNRYKTAFELPQRSLIQMSIDRGPFVDQSQSLNLFFEKPDFDRLGSALFFAWENGLKTGMYYHRVKPAVKPISFGLDPDAIRRIETKYGINRYSILSDDGDDEDVLESDESVVDIDSDVHGDVEDESDSDPEPAPVSEADLRQAKINALLAKYTGADKPTPVYEPCESCSG